MVGPAGAVGAAGGGRADAVTVTVIVPGGLGFPCLDEPEGRGGVRRVNVRLRVGADELEETGTDEAGADGIGVEGAGVEGTGVNGARVEGGEVEGARVEGVRVEEGDVVEGVGADGAGASELRLGGSAGSFLKLLVSGASVAELTTELDGAEVVLVPTGSLKEDEGPAAGAEDSPSATGAFDSAK